MNDIEARIQRIVEKLQELDAEILALVLDAFENVLRCIPVEDADTKEL